MPAVHRIVTAVPAVKAFAGIAGSIAVYYECGQDSDIQYVYGL